MGFLKISSLYSFLIVALLLTGCNELRDTAAETVSSEATPTPTPDANPCNPTTAPFGGGDGALATPYLICTVTQLQQISDMSKNYQLKADLNLNSVSFSPLGTYAAGFSGTFDGANHTISNWTYAAANLTDGAATIQAGTTHADYAVGFFRSLQSGAIVKNLTLSNVSIKGRYFTGGLTGYMRTGSLVDGVRVTTTASSGNVGTATTGIIVGFNDIPTAGGSTGKTAGVAGEMEADSTVTNSSFDGWVRGAMHVGGLVGNTAGIISNSHSSGSIKGRDGNSGGFVGNVGGTGSVVSGSYSTVTAIEIAGNSGGFVGSVNAGGLVTTSYFNGIATGSSLGIGGFVGYVIGAGAKITKCYSAGTVIGASGSSYAGGFAGWIKNGGSIEDSYSIANVTSASWSAGFLGVLSYPNSDGTVSRVYSTGMVNSSSAYHADLVGYVGAGGVVNSSYADQDASSNGIAQNIVAASTPYAAGTLNSSASLTTTALKDSANYSGWDFTTVWQIDPAVNNGYPTLR